MNDALDESDLQATFTAGFAAPLKLRPGKVQPRLWRPFRLNDPSFDWVSGYVHALPMLGLPASTQLRYPGWSSVGKRVGGATQGEAEAYPNADAIAATGISPFSYRDGNLLITARPMPRHLHDSVPAILPADYLSGALATYPFGQLYGYFEMRARLPAGPGLWPAFWLLPCDLSWPPEIDIMEAPGDGSSRLYTTIHTGYEGHRQHFGSNRQNPDLARQFHRFGADWGPERVVFYLNRRPVYEHRTPPDLHRPCYMLTNLAVGAAGSWAGQPNAQTWRSATFTIASIHVWQRRRYLMERNSGPLR